MKIISAQQYREHAEEFRAKIADGAIFIHGTDTIYGIGCSARNNEAVERVRDMKARPAHHFSIIAPGMQWIEQNCAIPPHAQAWLRRLPGPYTLILPLKNSDAVSRAVNLGSGTLGVRMPRHWMQDECTAMGMPIVSTCANRAGEPLMTGLRDIDPRILRMVDFVIDEGAKPARPSTVVDLSREHAIVSPR